MVCSQNGTLLAADQASELHIDYVYQRLDAKKTVASSGVTPAATPVGAFKKLLFHRALSFAVIKGLSGSLVGDQASQSLASAAEITESQQHYHACTESELLWCHVCRRITIAGCALCWGHQDACSSTCHYAAPLSHDLEDCMKRPFSLKR